MNLLHPWRGGDDPPPGPLAELAGAKFPPDGTPVADLRLLALDLETTGLDPQRDSILAIGFVPVDGLRIDLAGARRLVVHHEGDLGEGVALHGLTHDLLAAGLPLAEVVGVSLEALAGRALLAHHAVLEQGFLATACRELWGAEPSPVIVDTLELQRRLVTTAWEPEPPPGSLRLWQARSRFGLPEVPAHDALSDALACAELYLAQVAELGADRRLTLGQLRSGSRRRWGRSVPRR